MAQTQPLFGLVPAGQPVLTQPTEAPSATSFLYSVPVPPDKASTHIVVFLLPGVALPQGTAAAIYLVEPPHQAQGLQSQQQSSAQQPPSFRFLGGVGPGKESAIFKLSSSAGRPAPGTGLGTGAGTGGGPGPPGPLAFILGISIEAADSVAQRIAELQTSSTSTTHAAQQGGFPSTNSSIGAGPGPGPGPGGPSSSDTRADRPDTLLLAQRIIQNAFNFLSSFSGTAGGGVEVVPLRAFEDWWRKFESRIRSDPGFLERDS